MNKLLLSFMLGLLLGPETGRATGGSVPPPIESAGAHQSLVPASAHAEGIGGTIWVTDVVLHNPADLGVDGNVYFLESGQDNSTARGRRVFVSGGESLALADVVQDTFGLSSASGALLFGSDSELLISSRTFNNLATGTLGQYLPGLSVSRAIGTNDEARLIQLTRNSDYRTNIGFANATGSTLDVEVALYNGNGGYITEKSYSVPPYGYHQATDIIGINIDDAYAVVVTRSPGASYFAYGSIVDNRSGDPMLVLPAATAAGPGTEVYISAAAHAVGVGGTNWRTDVEIHNPGAAQADFRFELLEKDQANSAPSSRTFALAAGRSARYEDILGAVFGYSGTGALRITPTSGELLVTSRTYNDVVSGTYGQFIPGMALSAAISSEQTAHLIQLSHSSSGANGYRTNLGFVNATGSAINVEVRLFTGTGSFLGAQTYALQPFEYNQVNDIFAAVSDSVPEGYAIVRTTSSGASFFAYASVVDNRSGDPVFIPALIAGDVPGPPASAPGVFASTVSATRIDVTWTAVAGATGFWLQRGGTRIGSFDSQTRSYSDQGCDPSTRYCYTVAAFNEHGDGPESSEACATTSACTYTIQPTSANFDLNGGSGSATVSTSTACSWAAASTSSWIWITSGLSGTGDGAVTYSVDSNGGAERSGAMTIAGQTFTVNQDGETAPQTITLSLPNDEELILVLISAGTFAMGSAAGEEGRYSNEDEHHVTLTDDYYIGKYEVTQGQWEAVMGSPMTTSCGSFGVGHDYPVYCVTWNDVAASEGFMARLNDHLTATGQLGAGLFRLPTEAEWERAARAGTQTRFSHGDATGSPCTDNCDYCDLHDDHMVWCGNDGGGSEPVGRRQPNSFDLHDMHGNVWEWVQDVYAEHLGYDPQENPLQTIGDPYRVNRGGGWNYRARRCRSASRRAGSQSGSDQHVGFRAALAFPVIPASSIPQGE